MDSAGNAATLVHAAVTDNTGFRVDTTAPTLALTSYTSAENATAVVKLAASDANALSYSLVGAGAGAGPDNSLFKLTADGQLSFVSAPNFEQPRSAAGSNAYAITVDITDAAGNTTRQALTVNVTNQDEVAPTLTSGALATAILENSGANQTIYTATSTDTGDIATGATIYSLKPGSDAGLSINGTSGSVKLTASPNFEAKSSYSFTVVATDAAGNAAEKAVTLAITNQDEVAPTLTSGAVATTILENSGANQTIYTATSTDTGDIATGATAYSLKAGSDASLLSINSGTGAVTLTANPDFETKPSYSFTVVATDAAGNASEKTVSLAITNLNDTAPVFTSGATGSVAENASTSTVIYTAATTDADNLAARTYTLSGTDADLLSITTEGVVTLKAPADFETKPSYSFNVVANDGANTATQAVVVTVGNLDEVAPTITSGAVAAAIPENSGANQTIYTATSTDTGDIATGATAYSLKAGSDAGLSIDSTSGAVKLTANPDFETKSSYSFTVVATDAAGNSAENTVSLAINDLDEIAPSISSLALSAIGAQNSTLNASDTASVTVTMSEATTVTGTPQLTLNIGGTPVQANYVSGSGSTSLVFSYTIQAGDNDSNGISINANSLTLNGGTLKDAAGNAATLTHLAMTDNTSYKVDTTAPTVSSLALSAIGAQNGTLNAGDTVSVTATMNEVTTVTGTPQMALNIGGNTVQADYASGSGGTSLVFSYTIQAGDNDSNGISIKADSLNLNGGSLWDAAGNAATLTHLALTDNTSYKVDTTSPTVSNIAFTSRGGAPSNILNAGDSFSVTVTMSEVTTVTGSPQLALNIGGATVYVLAQGYYDSGSGGTALVFSYNIQEGQTDIDGISIAANSLKLSGGSLLDVAGNVATLTHAAVTDNASYKVDTTAPTVTNTSAAYKGAADTLVLTGANYSTLLDNGEDATTDIKARLDWSKLVWDINGDNGATPDVSFTLQDISSAKVTDGTHLSIVLNSAKGAALEATAGYSGGTADTVDITAGFARDMAGNVATSDAVVNAILSISLVGQSVIDLGSYGKLIAPVQVDGGKWYYYWDRSGDGTTADVGTLNSGKDTASHQELNRIFKYDVNGVLSPYGGISTDDYYRYATINGVLLALPTAGGSTSTPYGPNGIGGYQPGTAVGSATPANGSNADNPTYDDLLAIWDAYNGTSTETNIPGTPSGWRNSSFWSSTPLEPWPLYQAYISLRDGSVTSGLYIGLNLFVALEVIDPTVTNTTAPTVSSLQFSASGAQNSTLNAGDTVSVTVTMSKATTVTGIPQLFLNIGGATVLANYASGSGSTSLVFSYTIQAGQTDTYGISIAANSLKLNGGSLSDAAGNAATLAHASVADNASYKVDAVDPSINSLALSASGAQNSTLNAGDTASVTVTMSEATTVTGTPQLDLNIGGTTVQANYASGSGTTSLVFNYIIQAGQTDTNGISIAANSLYLKDGSLLDAAGNVATLTHAAVTDNVSYKVDTTTPTVTNTSAAYTTATNTLVLTGSNYSTLLETVENAATDIKARLDWSKLVWDINGDNGATPDVSFTLADISSAKVTDGTHLSVVLTSAKGTALEATASFGGATPDTLDVAAGFSKDLAGNAANADSLSNGTLVVIVPVAGDAVIDLGSYGKLIAPVKVDGGKWYYYWDRSGDGTSTNAGGSQGIFVSGVDYTTHDDLDGIFNRDINGVVNTTVKNVDGAYGTTDIYRYATINFVNLALPTAGGAISTPYGPNGIDKPQPNSAVGSATTASGSNADNATYNDLLAIWDAYNGTSTETNIPGTPPGWQANASYWAATSSSSGHASVGLDSGYVYDRLDDNIRYVALQVL